MTPSVAPTGVSQPWPLRSSPSEQLRRDRRHRSSTASGTSSADDNTLALPIGAGIFAPTLGLVLRPELAAISMAGSSLIVAGNALMLKRLHLPRTVDASPPTLPSSLLPTPTPATGARHPVTGSGVAASETVGTP